MQPTKCWWECKDFGMFWGYFKYVIVILYMLDAIYFSCNKLCQKNLEENSVSCICHFNFINMYYIQSTDFSYE